MVLTRPLYMFAYFSRHILCLHHIQAHLSRRSSFVAAVCIQSSLGLKLFVKENYRDKKKWKRKIKILEMLLDKFASLDLVKFKLNFILFFKNLIVIIQFGNLRSLDQVGYTFKYTHGSWDPVPGLNDNAMFNFARYASNSFLYSTLFALILLDSV